MKRNNILVCEAQRVLGGLEELNKHPEVAEEVYNFSTALDEYSARDSADIIRRFRNGELTNEELDNELSKLAEDVTEMAAAQYEYLCKKAKLEDSAKFRMKSNENDQ